VIPGLAIRILDMARNKAAEKKAKAAAKQAPNPAGTGRPTWDTPETKDAIILLVTQGYSLRAIGRMDGMPSRETIAMMLAKDPDFSGQYARAWQASADIDFEEMYEIADDGSNDWMEMHDRKGEFIGYQVNGEALGRSKLRIDQRKWAASKKAPKKYGDKLDLSVGGNGSPIASIDGKMTDEQAAQLYADTIRGNKG